MIVLLIKIIIKIIIIIILIIIIIIIIIIILTIIMIIIVIMLIVNQYCINNSYSLKINKYFDDFNKNNNKKLYLLISTI